MEKYLQELIETQSRVIIPDFGAFINSRDDDEQHIVFNNFLTFNDGLLVSHICEKEGINSDQAISKINNYISKIKSALSDNKEYYIEKIGTLHKSDEGFISFAEEKREVEEPDNIKVEEELPTDEEAQIEELQSPVKVDENDLLILDEEEIEEKPVAETKEQIEVKPPIIIQEEPQNVKPQQKAPIIKETHTVEKEKKRSFLWLIILLLLLLITFLGIYFFTDIFSKDTNVEIAKEEITEIVEEVAITDSIEKEAIVEEVIKEPIIIRQHHIIVGTFKTDYEATEHSSNLRSQGYENANILEHQGKFLVSITWFKNVSEALRYQEKLAGVDKIENWILSIDGEE